MKTRIIDNWEVELTNDKGDILTLKGQWYADFFKEYENKQLIIANVVGQSKQLVCECEPHSYYEWEKEENKCDKCGKPLVNITSIKNKPITPEMLQAYGFEKNDMGEGEFYYSLRLSDERYCDLALITGDKNGCMEVCLFPYEDFFRVRYEHEMLAMYKGITGKDLVSKQYFKSKVIPTSKFAKAIREASLFDADLSIRCLNVFHANKDKLGIDLSLHKVKDLSKLSIREFLSCRNAGKKTAEELKELCFYAGVELMP